MRRALLQGIDIDLIELMMSCEKRALPAADGELPLW